MSWEQSALRASARLGVLVKGTEEVLPHIVQRKARAPLIVHIPFAALSSLPLGADRCSDSAGIGHYCISNRSSWNRGKDG